MGDLNNAGAIPSPPDFQIWLRDALLSLDVKPARLGRELELGKNTVSCFLSGEGRGIELGNASKMHAWLLAFAAEKGVTLGPIGAVNG